MMFVLLLLAVFGVTKVQAEPIAFLVGGKLNWSDALQSDEYYYPRDPSQNIIGGRYSEKMTLNLFVGLVNRYKPLVIYGGGLGVYGTIFPTTMFINPYLILRQTPGPLLTITRVYPGYAVIENFGLLVCGGHDKKGRTLETCEHYSQAKGKFVRTSPMPLKLMALSLVSYKGKAYIVGGLKDFHIHPTKDVFVFDPHEAVKKWKKVATTMPFARKWHSSAVIGDVIYACGGWIDGVNMRETPFCDAYNVETNHWESFQGPKNHIQLKYTMLTMDEKLYLFGGYKELDTRTKPLRTVLSFHPKLHQWKYEHELINSRADAGGCVVELPPPE